MGRWTGRGGRTCWGSWTDRSRWVGRGRFEDGQLRRSVGGQVGRGTWLVGRGTWMVGRGTWMCRGRCAGMGRWTVTGRLQVGAGERVGQVGR